MQCDSKSHHLLVPFLVAEAVSEFFHLDGYRFGKTGLRLVA